MALSLSWTFGMAMERDMACDWRHLEQSGCIIAVTASQVKFRGKCLQVFGCHSIAWSMKAMLPYVTFICILYSESRCSPHARVAWVNLANFSYEWAKSFLFVMYLTVYSVSYQDPNVASPPTSLFSKGPFGSLQPNTSFEWFQQLVTLWYIWA